MSTTKSSHSMKMSAVPMQELREVIESNLQTLGYTPSLENAADNDISYLVSKGPYASHLTLYRTRHKPLQLEIEADYDYFRSQKERIKSQRKSEKGRTRSSNSFYRYFWIYILFGGVILTVIYTFSQFLLDFFDRITPGWSSGARAGLIILIVFAILIIWLLVFPILSNRRNKLYEVYDKQIISHLTQIFQNLEASKLESLTLKCWSCYKDLDPGAGFCPHCGKNQN